MHVFLDQIGKTEVPRPVLRKFGVEWSNGGPLESPVTATYLSKEGLNLPGLLNGDLN